MANDPLAQLEELPGVFESVDAARAAIDGLLREPVLRRNRGAVRAESRRHGSWASARLAGVDVALEEYQAPFREDDPGRLCAASLRLGSEVGTLAQTWRQAPLQALARLHVLAASDVAPEGELGRPRADPVVSARLSGLAEAVSTTSASGIVVAAVVHGELLDLQPFGWGDDLIARAASRLVLVARGVDPDALTVPEEGMLRLGVDRLSEALAAYQSGKPAGMAQWLVHVAASVQQGAAVARTLC